MLNRRDYLRQWSGLHGGVEPAGLVGAWLGLVHGCARPFARFGVRPDAVTVLGLVPAALALWAAAAGGRWPLLAVVLVLISALLDGLDGAVAVISGRVTRFGAVLDQACDRLAELCFVGALWLAGDLRGAAAGCCLAGVALAWLHEQVRAGARAGGLSEVAVVTVAERPTRVIVTVLFLAGAGLFPAAATAWATAGALAWTGAGAVGLTQLIVALRQRLD